ncbi:chromosomal replication initiator protein DnaA [Corynebacterium variabile]|uniref:chromosomal replication initiator protein DnaA n=1 Tax=Corynebacterium variabile TaxID=1727 RepID=UPI003A93851A
MTTAEDFPTVWANLVTRWVTSDAASAEFPEVTPRSRSLLQQLDPVVLVNGIAVLTAPSKWVRTETEKKLSAHISEVLEREIGMPVTLSLSVKELATEAPTENAPAAATAQPAEPPVQAVEPVDAAEAFEEPRRSSQFGDLPSVPPGPVHTPDLWENMDDAAFPHPEFTKNTQVNQTAASSSVSSAAPATAAYAEPAQVAEPVTVTAGVPVTTAATAPAAAATHADDENRLNPKYTFDTFVTGPSNQFPAAACRAVAENPGKAYNPLFIYGQPGLGKTHLLHAIGHYARELKPEIRVRYVSSEEMTNEFINAIQGGPLALDQFKRNYRNLDLLIVDDIQFLQGKESTQEEFFHTFNALYQANHQIVLSSDRPPSQLTTLEDRLRTRFEGGLTTDVKTPDLETRMAILAKKSLLNGAEVPRDVLEFIASRNESSIRELEGALTRVVAYCSMTGEPITIAAAEVVVKDILPQDVKITPEMVIEVIADHFTVSIDQLTGPSKVRKIVTARQFGMFLTREYCEMSTTKIGEVYGGRDHTTVMHAEKKMRTAIQENTAIFEQFQELTQKIKSRARQR